MGLNNPCGCKGVRLPKCPLVNGGFETGDFTGWSGCYPPAACTIIEGDTLEGNYRARLSNYDNHWPSILQWIDCNPTNITIDIDYRLSHGGDIRVVIYALDYYHSTSVRRWSPTTWYHYSHLIPGTVLEGPLEIRIMAAALWHQGSWLDVDNITLTE